MKRKVLVDFDYAFDGVHANRLRAGRSYEIRDEHVARFEAEGKIEREVDEFSTAEFTAFKAKAEAELATEDWTVVDGPSWETSADEADAPGRAKSKGKGRGRK